MFLVPTLPHDPSRLGTYCQALLSGFDEVEFTRFYADALGKLLEHEVDTTGGFKDVLFRLLLKSQHDGTLRELLVTALCYRAGNAMLVDMLDDFLAVQPIVELAAFLADHQYQPRRGQEVVDALYAERLVRKRPWMHREGRAAWIEVLIICDNLPDGGEPIPPLITGLNAIDETWRPRGCTTTLRERIDSICTRYGITSTTWQPSTARASESLPAVPQATSEEDSEHPAQDHTARVRLLSTLKSGWRAATSDGQGAYQIGMLCFGLAAFFFHVSVRPQKLEQAYLQQNLPSPQEPSRPARHPALDVLLLPSANTHGHAAPGGHPSCNPELLELLDKGFGKFEAAYRTELPYPHNLSRIDPWPGGGSAPWTDDDPTSTLLIPGFLAHLAEQRAVIEIPRSRPMMSPDPCAQNSAPSQVRCILRRPLERSLAITTLTKIVEQNRAQPELPQIKSFYVITQEGIRRSIPHVDPGLLATRYGSHGASYLDRVRTSDGGLFSEDGPNDCKGKRGKYGRVGTLPHFDPLGSGMQETICYPLKDSSNAAELDLTGVLCADIAISFTDILSRLQEASNTLKLSLFRVSGSGKVDSCRGPDGAAVPSDMRRGDKPTREGVPLDEQPCPTELAPNDQPLRDLATKYYENHLKGPKLDPFGLGGLTPIRDDGYYGVVVAAAKPGEGPWYVAIARLRPSTPRNYSSMALCALFLLAGVCVLVMSFRRKLKRQQALLARGLHYGLLEVEGGKILGANDRAEEILLTDLPRLGIHTCNQLGNKTLSGMLDEERCVLVPASGQLRETDIRTYDTTIKDRASDGLTSTFYAWVKLRRTWIKIISTVILLPDHGERVLCTLDPHIDEAHRLFLANLRQGAR